MTLKKVKVTLKNVKLSQTYFFFKTDFLKRKTKTLKKVRPKIKNNNSIESRTILHTITSTLIMVEIQFKIH